MKSETIIERISSVVCILCKIHNDNILKNTIIEKLQESFKLILIPMKFNNQQLSMINIYAIGYLAFLVIILGTEILHPKVQLERGHKIGNDWSIKALRLMFESDSAGYVRVGTKEVPIQEIFEVSTYI